MLRKALFMVPMFIKDIDVWKLMKWSHIKHISKQSMYISNNLIVLKLSQSNKV